MSVMLICGSDLLLKCVRLDYHRCRVRNIRAVLTTGKPESFSDDTTVSGEIARASASSPGLSPAVATLISVIGVLVLLLLLLSVLVCKWKTSRREKKKRVSGKFITCSGTIGKE